MNAQEVIETANALVSDQKSPLAMDESTATCDRRFSGLGIPQTEEARRASRELLLTTSGLGECVSGAILYGTTIRQRKTDAPFLEVATPGPYRFRSVERCSDLRWKCGRAPKPIEARPRRHCCIGRGAITPHVACEYDAGMEAK